MEQRYINRHGRQNMLCSRAQAPLKINSCEREIKLKPKKRYNKKIKRTEMLET